VSLGVGSDARRQASAEDLNDHFQSPASRAAAISAPHPRRDDLGREGFTLSSDVLRRASFHSQAEIGKSHSLPRRHSSPQETSITPELILGFSRA